MNFPPEPKEQYDLGFQSNSLEVMMDLFNKHGNIYRVYSPYRKTYTYVLSHPDYAKHILVNNQRNYVKGVGIDRVKILLGNGIMVSEGDYWKRQRRMIQPSFHRQVIAGLTDLMKEENHSKVKRWKELMEKSELMNITEETSDITLQIVLKSIFGNDLEKTIRTEGVNPFNLVKDETNRDLQFARRFRGLGKVIKKYKNEREEEKRIEHDFLSMLMETTDKETGEKMTEKELVDEVMTLIVAGHETTASVLNWAWYFLGTNKEVDEKLFQEVKKLGGEVPSFEQLSELPYTKMVIQESMRLYPPGWLLTRRALADDKIGDFDVPAKSDVFVSPYMIQRSPDIWEDPEAFIPERFEKEIPRYNYFPFAAGPRQCIGDFFALVEMQMHIAYMIQHFRVEYVEKAPLEIEPLVNLRTKNDLFLRLHPR